MAVSTTSRTRIRSVAQHLAGAREPHPPSITTDDVRRAWGREAEARLLESGLEVRRQTVGWDILEDI